MNLTGRRIFSPFLAPIPQKEQDFHVQGGMDKASKTPCKI